MRLHPRHRIDVGPGDLAFGLAAALRALDRGAEAASLEARAGAPGEVLAALSVRSAFDLLLQALSLPAGSEVMMSALTIPDMPRLVEAHGLVPVPVDIDPATLSPAEGALERALSAKSHLLVVAQLFGARADMPSARAFADRHGLLLVDDDAQGLTDPARLAASVGDVSLHSFGTIKTATSLGGALCRVRDRALLGKMRALEATWPVQPTAQYAKKLSLHAALLPPRQPRAYTLFAEACERLGPGLDEVVMGMTRGFPAHDTASLLARLRHRPSAPLLSMMARRLDRFDRGRVERRRVWGEALCEALSGEVEVLGGGARDRTHWLFAVQVDEPARLIAPLRRAGFDAARGASSIDAVRAPEGRPGLAPERALEAMRRVLFLPAYPEMPMNDIERLGREVKRLCRER